MAITLPKFSFFFIITISAFISSILYQAASKSAGILGDDLLVKHGQNKRPMREKLSHFRFYWHDVVSGPHPTSINITKALDQNSFGMVCMIDNPLTVGPELGSKVVGRAQGFYASASQQEVGLLMTMNFVFTTGKYNCSTISILGRNAVLDKVREMPVIGGSGLFRFARGYVQARTNKFDIKTGDATVEYNVYVMHY